MISNKHQKIALIVIFVGVLGLAYTQFRTRISIEDAHELSETFLDSSGYTDIEVGEVMEFTQNYYIVFVEKSTDIGAFEMLLDKQTGRITPEYGPNMMWNTKFSHGGRMHSSPSSPIIYNEEMAVQQAQEFLDDVYPGAKADDLHPFYGYYTLHTKRNGEIFGMLSVNQVTGAVWYHNWHGDYIQSLEAH